MMCVLIEGTSLAKGRIDLNTGCLVCPYHTFKFNEKGRMVQTPGSDIIRINDKFKLKTDVPYFDVLQKGGWVYLRNEPLYEISATPTCSGIWIDRTRSV